MKRMSFGSDIATIGMWDKTFLTEEWQQSVSTNLDEQIEKDTETGQLFVIDMGGDGGDYAHVYANERIPEEDKQGYEEVEKTYLIRSVSGTMTLGGLEDYNREEPHITSDEMSTFELPAGDYELRLFQLVYDEENEYDPDIIAHEKLQERSKADYDYWMRLKKYRMITTVGMMIVMGFVIKLLLLDSDASCARSTPLENIFYLLMGGIIGLIIGRPLVRWIIGNNERFKKMDTHYSTLYDEAEAASPPWFLFELSKIEGEHYLKGGIYEIE